MGGPGGGRGHRGRECEKVVTSAGAEPQVEGRDGEQRLRPPGGKPRPGPPSGSLAPAPSRPSRAENRRERGCLEFSGTAPEWPGQTFQDLGTLAPLCASPGGVAHSFLFQPVRSTVGETEALR